MSLNKNKLIIFLLALSGISVAHAGNYDENYDDVKYIPAPPVYSGIYMEADGGIVARDWASNIAHQRYIFFAQGGGAPPFGNFSNGKDTATVGFVFGYQWSQYFAVEISWNGLWKTQYYTPAGVPVLAGGVMVHRTQIAYLAMKFSFPIYEGLYVFSKVGAANVNITTEFNFALARGLPGRGDYWTPTFATGLQYYFSWDWYVNLQYLHANGYARQPLDGILRKVPSPHSDMFTLGVGYKFAI